MLLAMKEEQSALKDNSFGFHRLVLIGASAGFVGTPKLDTWAKYG
jgi:hypothetical protein